MSSMEQSGQANEAQPQQAQQQGAYGENSQLNPQEQAKAASREALEAQQEAQEAIKRAYIKQMTAQEKAEQASQQVVAEQEMAKRVAAQAATEAAEKAANEQKERGSKELRDTLIAQEAAKSALASFGNQSSNQQGQPTPSYQSGFVPYSSAVHNASVQPRAGQEGAVQQGQSQPMTQDNNAMGSAQRCQEMLMQGANQLAQSATAQMTAAQNLAASAPNPEIQQAAREQAETAQSQMMLAHQIAAAAQSPDTAVHAAASLFNKA